MSDNTKRQTPADPAQVPTSGHDQLHRGFTPTHRAIGAGQAGGGDDRPRSVVLLGSTGSIGTQCLEVAAHAPDQVHIVGLASTGSNPQLVAQQCATTGARALALSDSSTVDSVSAALRDARCPDVDIVHGPQASAQLAAMDADVVLNAVAGAAGLLPSLAALKAGRTLALANKESLIIGGSWLKNHAAPTQIVPVDSEHMAIAQCLRAGARAEVARLVLTASGGPFRGYTADQLDSVTPHQAMAHPTWDMGPLITINSASMVNKGLEIIEAHLLFDIAINDIAVVVHPQSMVHSWVEFIDGSCIMQASPPDMKLPISLGLCWPHRVAGASAPLDITTSSTWTFEPLDEQVFASVALARAVGTAGGTYPAAFNAANEVAVDAFVRGLLKFSDITTTIDKVVQQHQSPTEINTVDQVLHADQWARASARAIIGIPEAS